MIHPEDIAIRVLRDLEPTWDLEASEWYSLGYSLNTRCLVILPEEWGVSYDVLEFTLDAVAEIVSKVMWGNAWNNRKKLEWLETWHRKINKLHGVGDLERLDEEHAKMLGSSPFVIDVR